MRSGRPKTQLTINETERAKLSGIARSHSMPAALVLRAKIVLACECEASNQAVAARLALCPHTVGKWRNRFVAERLAGLYDEVRAGRPRTVKDEAVATLISKTLTNKPAAATHWSVRSMAEETGLSKSTVHRLFQLFALQPHRTRSFKISSDPFFVEKLRDIVGLYLNPPDKALVLCVDEKSQVQALERTQPMLPIGFGYVEGVTPITSVTALPPCSPRSMCSTARSWRSASRVIAIRNISPFCATSKPRSRKDSTSISLSTTTPPTSTERSKPGLHNGRAGRSTSRPPTPPGSTK